MNYEIASDFDVGWQYQEAENLRKIIKNRDDFISENLVNFFKNFEINFNLDTCDLFGLRVWSIILGVTQKFTSGSAVFGFDNNLNFNNGTFNAGEYVGMDTLRLLLKLKYRKITKPSNFTTLEESLMMIDPSLRLQDNGDMSIIIFSDNDIEYQKLAIISDRSFLSIPNSVSVNFNINMKNKFYLDWFSFDRTTLQ